MSGCLMYSTVLPYIYGITYSFSVQSLGRVRTALENQDFMNKNFSFFSMYHWSFELEPQCWIQCTSISSCSLTMLLCPTLMHKSGMKKRPDLVVKFRLAFYLNTATECIWSAVIDLSLSCKITRSGRLPEWTRKFRSGVYGPHTQAGCRGCTTSTKYRMMTVQC